MRLNTPVTAVEYPFPRGETLVSVTDLKGRITYCNPAFITVSGFQRDELLGQPHIMIRHPDMPEEAFRDMWETIAAGLPWSGYVKNRRKDGSFYWVLANVTPLMEGDHPSGFMSVRTEPARDAVQACESLYATMRSEKAAGKLVHTLKAGRVIKAGLAGRIARLADHLPRPRLGLLSAALAGAGYAVVTCHGTIKAKHVLIATNGYTDEAAHEIGRRVSPLGSYIIATERLPVDVAAKLIPQRRVVFDSKHYL